MVEKFNGIFYLTIFLVHFLTYGFYTYRCLFDTRAFLKQYGLEASWAFFNLVFLQNFCSFVFAAWSHQKKHLGVNEKTSLWEGIIVPGILTLLSAVLCYGISDKIYI